jgi:hypothetical protein
VTLSEVEPTTTLLRRAGRLSSAGSPIFAHAPINLITCNAAHEHGEP